MNPGLPILDASYNKKQNSKGAPTPTPGSSTASGLPVLDATFNSQFKKKLVEKIMERNPLQNQYPNQYPNQFPYLQNRQIPHHF